MQCCGCIGRDGVIARNRIKCVFGVCDACVVTCGHTIGHAAIHERAVGCGRIGGEGNVVDNHIAIRLWGTCVEVGSPKRQGDGLGAGGGIDDGVVTALLVVDVVDGQRSAVHIRTQTSATRSAITQVGGIVELEGVGLTRFHLGRGLPEHGLGAAGNVRH